MEQAYWEKVASCKNRTHIRKIVSVLHQDEGGIGKSIPDAQKISRDPRDFPREISRVEGNLVEILVEHGYSLAQETEKI